jgi:hypothetical protein
MGYIPGKYWGSSRNPILLQELKDNISDFEIEILEYVDDPQKLTTRELHYHQTYNVVYDDAYYNLQLAGIKFSSVGFVWCHDPISLVKAYMPKHKIPNGWEIGKTPQAKIKAESRTGYKRGDAQLKTHLSNAVTRLEWILKDPDGNIHIVDKLHKFCEENNVSSRLRLVNHIGKPIKKGKSKGWCVIEVRDTKG